jgi:hypothetical protein
LICDLNSSSLSGILRTPTQIDVPHRQVVVVGVGVVVVVGVGVVVTKEEVVVVVVVVVVPKGVVVVVPKGVVVVIVTIAPLGITVPLENTHADPFQAASDGDQMHSYGQEDRLFVMAPGPDHLRYQGNAACARVNLHDKHCFPVTL